MANRIDHLLFWTGGVLLPRLSTLALRALPTSGRDLALERRLEELERRLAQGELAGPDFCELAAIAAGAPGMAPALQQNILAGAQPLPGISGLLADLAPRVRLELVSDYPQPWLEALMSGAELSHFFAPAGMQYTANWPAADLFAALTREGIIHPGQTLWIDYDSPRAGIAIRCGVDAALCVDARRLRRDLGLWGLLPLASA